MESFRLDGGQVIREDHQPLKTKIVATIGSPTFYKKEGLYNLSNTKVAEPSYDYVVSEFYKNGVDIIRLNLAHVEVGNIKQVITQIKTAILKCEKDHKHRKRIALLADLPGPKIRYHLDEPVDFNTIEEFTVHFDEEVSTSRAATVYINDKPLKAALEMADYGKARFNPDIYPPEIAENIFGGIPRQNRQLAGSFQRMMTLINQRLGRNEKTLIFVGDGDVVMEIVQINNGTSLICKVITCKSPGNKSGRPGFTLKGFDFDIPAFTDEDRLKLDEVLDVEYENKDQEPVVGFIGLSFAQTAHDVLRIKEHVEGRLVRDLGLSKDIARLKSPSIIAKIETKKGWTNRDYILDVADCIMVARGDLGLQMDIEEVPSIQKNLIQLCNKRGKPVIIATEMLKSMMQSIEPTRAEGTDVFNAILDGADAVMTSDETAKGNYPFHAIRKMISIAAQAENFYEKKGVQEIVWRQVNLQRYQNFLGDEGERINLNNDRFIEARNALDNRKDEIYSSNRHNREELESLDWRINLYAEKRRKSLKQRTTNRITQATCTMSESTDIKAIIAATTSGRTVRMISRLRPSVIIIGAAHDVINTRKLAISYGVLPICIFTIPESEGTEGIFGKCRENITKDAYLNWLLSIPRQEEINIIFTAGTPLGTPGTTNLIQMRHISEYTD